MLAAESNKGMSPVLWQQIITNYSDSHLIIKKNSEQSYITQRKMENQKIINIMSVHCFHKSIILCFCFQLFFSFPLDPLSLLFIKFYFIYFSSPYNTFQLLPSFSLLLPISLPTFPFLQTNCSSISLQKRAGLH